MTSTKGVHVTITMTAVPILEGSHCVGGPLGRPARDGWGLGFGSVKGSQASAEIELAIISHYAMICDLIIMGK